MSTIITNEDGKQISPAIREFTRFLIDELTIYKTDENGFVVDSDGEPVLITSGKRQYRVSIYSTNISGDDIVILNPVNESIGKSSVDKTWLHEMMAIGLSARISSIIRRIASLTDEEAEDASPEVIDLVSKYRDGMPAKFKDEFTRLAKMPTSFINVWVDKKNVAKLRSIVFEQQFDNFKTTKTIKELITRLVKDIFKTEDISEYAIKAQTLKCPIIESTLMLYKMIYENVNAYLRVLVPSMAVDTIALEKYIEQLELFHDKSKWLVQNIKADKTDTVTTSSTVIPTSTVSTIPGARGISTVRTNPQPTINQTRGFRFMGGAYFGQRGPTIIR